MSIPGRAGRALIVAAAVLAVAACGPSEFELARAEREAERVRQEQLDDAPVWVGTVTGYDGSIDDLIVLDIGDDYPVRMDLARVKPVNQCDYDTDQDFDAAYTAAIQAAAPIGGRIAVVRSTSSTDRLERDKGFIHPVTPDGTPVTDGLSLNEQMARDGIAVPDPDVYLRREYQPL